MIKVSFTFIQSNGTVIELDENEACALYRELDRFFKIKEIDLHRTYDPVIPIQFPRITYQDSPDVNPPWTITCSNETK